MAEARPRIDWIPIRQEYIETNIGFRELADKYNIAFSSIGRQSQQEAWPELRIRFRTLLEQKANEKSIETKSDRLAKRNEDMAKAFKSACSIALNELNSLVETIQRKEKVSMKDVQIVISTLEQARRNERLEEGQPTNINQLNDLNLNIDAKPRLNYTIDELERATKNLLESIRKDKSIDATGGGNNKSSS